MSGQQEQWQQQPYSYGKENNRKENHLPSCASGFLLRVNYLKIAPLHIIYNTFNLPIFAFTIDF